MGIMAPLLLLLLTYHGTFLFYGGIRMSNAVSRMTRFRSQLLQLIDKQFLATASPLQLVSNHG